MKKRQPDERAIRSRRRRQFAEISTTVCAREIGKRRTWLAQRECGFTKLSPSDEELILSAIARITNRRVERSGLKVSLSR
jgi:hypothetical protein